MQLTDEQQAAVDAALGWWRRPAHDRFDTFVLYGYAGTGKTTIAKWIADTVQREGGRPVFAAYTGKAASVLSAKIGRPAYTLHKLLYDFRGTDDDGEPVFTPKEWSEIRRSGLFIVDECSMVPAHIMEKALEHGVPILALGDPAQLEPVKGGRWFHDGCDARLETIHRQAAGNPIIAASKLIREGHIDDGLKRLTRRRRAEIGASTVAGGDTQVLCYTNRRRRRTNANVRRMLGHDDWWPQPGEPLVGLQNNRNVGVLNGEMYEVARAQPLDSGLVRIRLRGRGESVLAHSDPLRGRELPCDRFDPGVAAFDWGYCITVHKAQGSEWARVVLFDDFPPNVSGYRNWLYTAVTRAGEELVYVAGR